METENTDFCIPCYNIIYNSIPYGPVEEKSQIDRLGVSSLRLAFTIEKPQDAVKIYEEFRAVYCMGRILRNGNIQRDILKEEPSKAYD